MKKHLLVIGIIFLFFISSVTQIAYGANMHISTKEESQITESIFDSPVDSAWPMYQHDSANTGYSQALFPESHHPKISLNVLLFHD